MADERWSGVQPVVPLALVDAEVEAALEEAPGDVGWR